MVEVCGSYEDALVALEVALDHVTDYEWGIR